MPNKTILVVGTFDTKGPELDFICAKIQDLNGGVIRMDVSVLGTPQGAVDISKHDVATAAGTTIKAIVAMGNEADAMNLMSDGACQLVREMHSQGRFDGILMLGGTMGTDLALDVCQSLPLGVPKYIVSTVAFSAMIPADRLTPDIQMILWAGGLYGLNSICKSSLSHAAGAVLGAALAVEPPMTEKPVVGITSLGTSCLKYITNLMPALEDRGYEVAIFHAMGMGGMAFEQIAAQRGFVCVMDFAGCELGNYMHGSVVNAGSDRFLNAGRVGIPQIIAPGCMDLIDIATWQDIPKGFENRHIHAHNKLIVNTIYSAEERRNIARELNNRLGQSTGPTHLIIPKGGIEEWDRPEGDCYDPEGLLAFVSELEKTAASNVEITVMDSHINDRKFSNTALEIFDQWVLQGVVPTPEAFAS